MADELVSSGDSGYSHTRPEVKQREHAGRPSSHFMRRFLHVAHPLFDLGAHRFCRVCSVSDVVVLLSALSGLAEVCELPSLEFLRELEAALLELDGELELKPATGVTSWSSVGSNTHALGVSNPSHLPKSLMHRRHAGLVSSHFRRLRLQLKQPRRLFAWCFFFRSSD